MNKEIINLLDTINIKGKTKEIANKILSHQRINKDDALFLYENSELSFLSLMANFIREQKNGNKAFYNKNFHIEPTNICIHSCKFCSYSRKTGEEGSWEHSVEEIMEKVHKYKNSGATEVHIVGGVHPNRDIFYYGKILSEIKNQLPNIHIKAFTAVEIDHMIKKAHLSIPEGLQQLKAFGLDSMPGGGAEIFDEKIRAEICGEKSSSTIWLKIHKEAHLQGIPTNATMLYGHAENYTHRVDHLFRLRKLQDETNGFNAFIPLKFRNTDNELSYIKEVSIIEDLRNYAVSRIVLDNFDHIKAYWPMIGKDIAQISLSYGVDDLDGTIQDSTKIYSMAGAEDTKPGLSSDEIRELITKAGRTPIERDSIYNEVKN